MHGRRGFVNKARRSSDNNTLRGRVTSFSCPARHYFSISLRSKWLFAAMLMFRMLNTAPLKTFCEPLLLHIDQQETRRKGVALHSPIPCRHIEPIGHLTLILLVTVKHYMHLQFCRFSSL